MSEAPAEFALMGLDASKFFRSDAVSWRGPCPRCGGHRRLLVFTSDPFPRWHVHCDGCGLKAWADQLNPLLKKPLDGATRAMWVAKTKQEQAEREAYRRRRLAEFTTQEIWQEYHERMTERERGHWDTAGIPREWQDYWQLGYVTGKTFTHKERAFTSDAMTIPIFDFGRVPTNIQYRIMDVPPGVGRYRQEAGIAAAAFLTDPDRSAFTDEVVIVEGAKKAAVFFAYSDTKRMGIGLPGARSWAGIPERVRECGRVYVALDPDAEKAAIDLCLAIGKNARLVRLPAKIDDLILNYGATFQDIDKALRYGRMEGK